MGMALTTLGLLLVQVDIVRLMAQAGLAGKLHTSGVHVKSVIIQIERLTSPMLFRVFSLKGPVL